MDPEYGANLSVLPQEVEKSIVESLKLKLTGLLMDAGNRKDFWLSGFDLPRR